ncbi:unnamed protein product [Paramecium pentaurelia]|uniref:Cilia- and flagella-associated protein 69 ARM repeats domain-containing protein n=1 Tax=Paramecium pentaurelia TaxID=43138 RepID=A0A8S1UYB6_9CILI|nr:unnamed protein product [Paramecium pentaurelia]
MSTHTKLGFSRSLKEVSPPQKENLSIQQVLEMFHSPYTEQLTDRKSEAIVRFCRQRSGGFLLEEMQELIEILRLSIAENNELMQPAIQKICETASVPFIKLRTSDQLKFVPKLSEFLDTLKPILYSPQQESSSQQPELRMPVIKFLKCFAEEGISEIMKEEASFEQQKKQTELSPLQHLLKNGTRNLRALNQSNLIENIIFTMQHYSKQYEYLLPLLELISSCILYRDLAAKFSNFGILKDIVYVIFECEDFRSYIVKSCFEIIWNTIEAVGVASIKLFAVEDIISGLKKLFENIMKQGYKLEDKCLRNEILILLNYLMRDEKALQYFVDKPQAHSIQQQTNFLEVLLFYATIDEVTFYNEPIRTNQLKAFFGTTSEDLEFKKLIWSGILTAVQSGNQAVLEAVKESPFIVTLLLYIDPLANSYAVNRWSPPQKKEIQLHCLGILGNAIVYLKDDFYEKNGLFCLTKFLTNTQELDHKERCLKAFNNASEFEQNYKIKICDEGVMDNLIEFLQNENDNDNPLKIKELCFSIISNLCKECNKNKKLFRQKGAVELMVNALKNPNLGTSARYALYAVSVLDCLWNTILGNRKSEAIFLDSEGLYVLLEFLETCDDMHKKLTLSCLSYLMENPKAIPYFCDWNSPKTMINSTQLLVKIYVAEDQRFGVKYSDGIVMNKLRPLNPQNDPSLRSTNQQGDHKTKHLKSLRIQQEDLESDVGSEAYLVRRITEKSAEYDLRAIVFAILYRTGFDKNELLPNEKQMVEVIQLYPHFKIGEIWREIKYDLEQDKIKPTSDDYHWLMTSIEESEELVMNCMNTQGLIAREFRKVQEEELTKFYDIIRSNKLTK